MDVTKEIHTQNPQEVMMQMLCNINEKLTTIQADVKELKENKTEVQEKLSGIQFDIDDNQAELLEQRKEINWYKDKVDMLTDLVIRQDCHLSAMSSKLSHLERQLIKTEIIIFGLNTSEEGCVEIVNNFFKQKLEIENEQLPKIKFAYWKGKGDNRPMIVRFYSPSAKEFVFSKVSNLKGKKNKSGKSYRITPHLLEEHAEIQKRQQQIIFNNRNLQEGNKQDIKIQKGKLLVNGTEYKNNVPSPSVESLLTMEKEDLHNVGELEVVQSREVLEQGNKFKMYATKVTSVKETRQFFQHLRLKHRSATHVSIAFRLASIDKAYGEGCNDDGEHGMGRRML